MVNMMNATLTPGKNGFHYSTGKLTLSVQWGMDNYCSNRSRYNVGDNTPDLVDKPVDTVEVAIWDDEGEWMLKNSVAGYVPMDKLPTLMLLVQNGYMPEIEKLLDGSAF